MKILFCITKGNFGGAQRYVYDLATNLPKDKFEVVVACGPGELLKEQLKKENIRVIELTSSERDINILKDIKTFFEIKKIIKEEKPDVLHLNSSKMGGIGALAGRLNKTLKIIFTGHGWAFNESRNLFEKILIKFLHWLTIVLSHTTIVVSKKMKQDIAQLPFIKEKTKVIHNGIQNFKTLRKYEAREVLGVADPKKVIILSLSELTRNKGIDVALRGLAQLPETIKSKITYCIAGSGEEKENLEILAKELKIENMVKFLGFVPDGKKLLSGADVFLLPSRTEAFPYVILEAGLTGRPIISTSVGGIPEVIHDMQNGILIHTKNPREITEAILYLLEHPQKQKEFSDQIKQTISSSFSLNKMLQETTNLYQ